MLQTVYDHFMEYSFSVLAKKCLILRLLPKWGAFLTYMLYAHLTSFARLNLLLKSFKRCRIQDGVSKMVSKTLNVLKMAWNEHLGVFCAADDKPDVRFVKFKMVNTRWRLNP